MATVVNSRMSVDSGGIIKGLLDDFEALQERKRESEDIQTLSATKGDPAALREAMKSMRSKRGKTLALGQLGQVPTKLEEAHAKYYEQGGYGRRDMLSERIDEAIARKEITPEEGELAKKRLLRVEAGPVQPKTDMQVDRINNLIKDGTLTPEEGQTALKRLTRVEAGPTNKNRIIRFKGADGKLGMVQVPENEFNTTVERLKSEGANLDTRQPRFDKLGDEYLTGLGFSPAQIKTARENAFDLNPKTPQGARDERRLSDLLTTRKKTLDILGDPVDTPEMNKTREWADKEIAGILEKWSGNNSVPSASNPASVASQKQGSQEYDEAAAREATDMARINLKKLGRPPTPTEVANEARRIYTRRRGQMNG